VIWQSCTALSTGDLRAFAALDGLDQWYVPFSGIELDAIHAALWIVPPPAAVDA
jgi:hypothetical protein